MWFNIDTRGHKKAQKSQNIAVGPEDPPPRYLPVSKTPGHKGLSFFLTISYEIWTAFKKWEIEQKFWCRKYMFIIFF